MSAGALEKARLAIEKRALDYTRPREEIREEIAKRQEKWRKRVRVEAPSERIEEKKQAVAQEQRVAVPDEEAPPPRMVFTKEDDGEGHLAGAPEGTEKVRLVYRSDFTKPTGWDEERSDFVYVFIQNGWYHIAFRRPQEYSNYYAFFYPPIILGAFRAQVDVERYITSGDTVDCGLIFCSKKENRKHSFMMFSTVSPHGYYRIHLERESEATGIVDWQKSELVKKGNDAENTLMIQRVEETITLGINCHILARETVSGLTPGHVGLFVRAYKDDAYAEARFRNFLLYEIDN